MVREIRKLVDERCNDLSWRTGGKWSDTTYVSNFTLRETSLVLPFQRLILYFPIRVT
jgi:hypothetical protein